MKTKACWLWLLLVQAKRSFREFANTRYSQPQSFLREVLLMLLTAYVDSMR